MRPGIDPEITLEFSEFPEDSGRPAAGQPDTVGRIAIPPTPGKPRFRRGGIRPRPVSSRTIRTNMGGYGPNAWPF